MSEVEICELLESDLSAYALVVQAIQEDECLVIILNRPPDINLDYTALTEAITARIKTLQLSGIHTLMLCSRVLGEQDVDWQTQLELTSPAHEPIAQVNRQATSSQIDVPSSYQVESACIDNQTTGTAIPIIPEPSSEVETIESVDATAPQEFNLRDYCFIRNEKLLRVEILPPPENIALAVQSFHALPDSSKETILPVLKVFFRSSEPLLIEQFDQEVQQWFEQMTRLKNTEVRTASIWLSRYCFDPENTMAEVMAVLEPETANTATAQEDEKSAADEQSSTTDSSTDTQRRTAQAPTRTNIRKTKKITQSPWQLALPIGWLIFTVVVIILAIGSFNSNELVKAACQNATGKQEYCRLAVQLVGELTFDQASQDTVPLTPDSKLRSLEDCERQGSILAGKTFIGATKPNIATLSSKGEDIKPGIFIADVKQTNAEQAGALLRTACVYRNTNRLGLLGTDVIPNNWPEQPYKGKPIAKESLIKAMGIYSILIFLGAGTLFTAVGIFVAAMFGLGIRVYSLQALYQAAFCLGCVKAITSLIMMGLPLGLGRFGAIALESLALAIVSVVVKGFHIEWVNGYRLVAAGTFTIIIVRASLNWLLFAVIASLVH